jgi:hypothetical protein
MISPEQLVEGVLIPLTGPVEQVKSGRRIGRATWLIHGKRLAPWTEMIALSEPRFPALRIGNGRLPPTERRFRDELRDKSPPDPALRTPETVSGGTVRR